MELIDSTNTATLPGGKMMCGICRSDIKCDELVDGQQFQCDCGEFLWVSVRDGEITQHLGIRPRLLAGGGNDASQDQA